MPELPNVVPGEPVESDWGNDIRDRTLQRYTDATDRDNRNPLPSPGDMAWLQDERRLQVYTPAGWTDQLQQAATNTNVRGPGGVIRMVLSDTGNLAFRALDGATNILRWVQSATVWELLGSLRPASNDVYDLGEPSLAFRNLDIRLIRASQAAAGNGVNIAPTAFGDGVTVMRLAIERAWRFVQRGTGAGTNLVLESESNKDLIVRTDNTDVFSVRGATADGVFLSPAQTGDRTTSLRNVMVAPQSLAGTTPAPTGGDGHLLIKYDDS